MDRYFIIGTGFLDGFQKFFLVIFAIWTGDKPKLCEKLALLINACGRRCHLSVDVVAWV